VRMCFDTLNRVRMLTSETDRQTYSRTNKAAL